MDLARVSLKRGHSTNKAWHRVHDSGLMVQGAGCRISDKFTILEPWGIAARKEVVWC